MPKRHSAQIPLPDLDAQASRAPRPEKAGSAKTGQPQSLGTLLPLSASEEKAAEMPDPGMIEGAEIALLAAGSKGEKKSRGRSEGEGLQNRLPFALEFSEHLRRAESMKDRVDALILARAIALAGLPKQRTKKRDVARTVRLGRDLWVRVTYSASEGQELPFGEDRFVLAGIIHLAIEKGSPLVFFDSAGELLKLFGIHRNDQSYELLRQRFKRIGGLSISLEFAETEEGLDDANVAQRSFVLSNYSLPSRKDIAEAMDGQRQLPLLPGDHLSRYGVVLSEELWRHLCQSSNHLLVPIRLLQMFVDNPTGWDYLIFLVARCGAARTPSKVPHEALMNLFKDAENEPDRKVIAKLKKIHALIMAATDGRLNARLAEDGYFAGKGPGRPRKRWCLHVGPSKSLFPDKRPRLAAGGDALPEKAG